MNHPSINFDYEKAQQEIFLNCYAFMYIGARDARKAQSDYPKHLLEFGEFCGGFVLKKFGERELNKRIKQIEEFGVKLYPSYEEQNVPNELWCPMLIASISLMELMPNEGLSIEDTNVVSQWLVKEAKKFMTDIQNNSEEWVKKHKPKSDPQLNSDGLAIINSNVRIVVRGTKRSIILDNGEKYVIEFNKGDPLREDLSNVKDLIENAINTSMKNGDMITSLNIDGFDLVKDAIIKELEAVNMNVDEAYVSVCQFPYMANADPSDVYDLVNEVVSILYSQRDSEN